MEIVNTIFMIVMMAFMTWVAYMGCHISEEKRKGEWIPLPWEKDGWARNLFDKNDVKYRDGDNT
jgi:hypothetical protein